MSSRDAVGVHRSSTRRGWVPREWHPKLKHVRDKDMRKINCGRLVNEQQSGADLLGCRRDGSEPRPRTEGSPRTVSRSCRRSRRRIQGCYIVGAGASSLSRLAMIFVLPSTLDVDLKVRVILATPAFASGH